MDRRVWKYKPLKNIVELLDNQQYNYIHKTLSSLMILRQPDMISYATSFEPTRA
jgi:hypothetical protein